MRAGQVVAPLGPVRCTGTRDQRRIEWSSDVASKFIQVPCPLR